MDEKGELRDVGEAMLNAYADDELNEAEEARVAEALAHDPALRRRLGEIVEARAALTRLTIDEEDDPATELLAERLSRRIERRAWRHRAFNTGLGVAATAAVATLGWFGHATLTEPVLITRGPMQVAGMPGAVPSFVADAAGAHDIFAHDDIHPVEFFASDERLMTEWFRQHCGEAAFVPDLSSIGFTLIGGRLLGDAEGAMGQIMYENGVGHRVSLVFGQRPVPGGSELRLVDVGRAHASYWQNRGLSWAVVEDSPGADVSVVATHLSKMTREY